MPPLPFIAACAAVACAVLAYLAFRALGLPANAALSFSLFGTFLGGMLLFAVFIAIEDKRRHVD
jgi:hypothetical protein